MNRRIIFVFIALLATALGCCKGAFAQVATDSNWTERVKTVTLYKNGVELEPPVLTLGSEDKLLLRFDVLGAETENYRYRIRHCNSRWEVDDLEPYEFLNGFEEAPIENYNSSFTTLTDYVNYYQYIPSQYSRFLASGNYVLTVFPQDAPDSIILSRRFYVVEGTLKADVSVTTPYDNASLLERREVDVAVSINTDYRGDAFTPSLNPAWCEVAVQQNGRWDNLRRLPFSGFERGDMVYRNRKENVFEGGNTFRWFDISNIRSTMYNVVKIEQYGGEWYAMLKPLEDRSEGNFITEQVLNGGMKVNVWDRTNKQTEADYVYVNFLLPMRYPYMNGNIYVVGDLTQWRMDEQSRMEYNPDLHAYQLRLLLKQGYYAYQLLFVPVGESEGLTSTLEGNHYETPNRYSVFVYYRSPNDRYDRLAAYRRVDGNVAN